MKDIRTLYNEVAKEYIESSGSLDDLSLESLERFTAMIPKQARVLDYGCGAGVYGEWLHDRGYRVQAMDISDEMVAYVAENYPELTPLRGEIYDVATHTLDAIWCSRVFHHIAIADQESFVANLVRTLKPEGLLYITCAHDDRDFEQNDSVNGALKKRLTTTSFEDLMIRHGLSKIFDKPWLNGWSEYMLRVN